MVTREKVQSVLNYFTINGSEKTLDFFNVSSETLNRYLRIARNTYGLLSDDASSVRQPKILLLDIETAPTKAYTWGFWQQNISRIQIISDGYMLCWAAKWLGDEDCFLDSLYMYPKRYAQDSEDDRNIVQTLANAINEADIVIGHNIKRFDLKVLRTRMIYYGMKPLKDVRVADTLLIAKSLFSFTHNGLDALGDFLGVGRKIKHDGFELWANTVSGDMDAFNLMAEEYCPQDVNLLEKVYLKLRPWDKKHPNLALFMNTDEKVCGCCGSDRLELMDFNAFTNISAFEVYECQDCFAKKRGRKNIRTKEQMKNTLTNIY